MATQLTKGVFFSDLNDRVQQHCGVVATLFQPLDDAALAWRPTPAEWSILQCFDHLSLTHDYYRPKIDRALQRPAPADQAADTYRPSFWGRIYMHFAFNPHYSFPTAEVITPKSGDPSSAALTAYLVRQDALLDLLERVAAGDLRPTPVPLDRGVRVNQGDSLNIQV